MKQLLVTSSSFPETSDEYEQRYQIDHVPFIDIEIYPEELIKSEIPENVQGFIVTSKNSAKAIHGIELNGPFFVVGQSTAKELYGQERNITFISNYSEDLLGRILDAGLENYVFFKGNLALTTIPDILHKNHINIKAIECYKTLLTPKKIEKNYDGIIFLSPSAVNSFFSINKIPKSTMIFASGKTTAQEIKKFGNFLVYYPEETTIESLVNLINHTLIND